MSEVIRVAIHGAGGHGKVVWEILTAAGSEVVGFVDERKAGELLGLPVVQRAGELPPFDGVIVAIGDNRVRREQFERLKAEGYKLVNAIHPSAILGARVRVGEGVVACAGVIVNVDATIGDNVILNTGSSVDHDCRIGSHTHIAPGSHLAGNVTIEEGAFLGIGTRVIPGKCIGSWATCGAGAVVIRDVEAGTTVVGVPAKPLERT